MTTNTKEEIVERSERARLEAVNIRLSDEVVMEMGRQLDIWGAQDHPSYKHDDIFATVQYKEAPPEDYTALAKFMCDVRLGASECSWQDILNEEVLEARDEAIAGNDDTLREELIQVAAVALSWVASLDRKTKRCFECGLKDGQHKMSCSQGRNNK